MRNSAPLTRAGGWPDRGPFTRGMKEGGGGAGAEKNEFVILANTGRGCLWKGSCCLTHTQSTQNTLSSGEAGRETLQDPGPSDGQVGWGEATLEGSPQAPTPCHHPGLDKRLSPLGGGVLKGSTSASRGN